MAAPSSNPAAEPGSKPKSRQRRVSPRRRSSGKSRSVASADRAVDAGQTLSTDKFLYFFLGLRKGEIRRRVQVLTARYPEETPERLAERVITAQRPLSLLAGALLELPLVLPAIAGPLKLLGVAGAASVLVRMHMAMILEIALLFGFDIDHRARLKEIAVVVAATGLASAAGPVARANGVSTRQSMLSGTLAVTTVGELIGRSAIAYYRRRAAAAAASMETAAALET